MMNETPILTIAIPTYNRKMLLRRALDSIFCQNNPNLEVLVSDNASNDGTDELLKEYSKIYTNLRFVVNDTNIGSMNNFLNCLKRASGKYIILLGSDDLVLPDSIQHIISFLTNNDNMSLVFLNHCGFYDEFISEEKCSKSFLENKCSDIVTHDKSLFLEHAKVQLTFMSALILNKSLINLEDKIQEYSETFFAHLSCS